MSLSLGGPSICKTLKVSLLGGICLQHGETAVFTLDARSQSLLAYLILNRTAHTRQHLAFLFWPDSTESQARTNLRKAIHKLRQKLPQTEQFLHINRRTIQWQPDASFCLDVDAFEQSLETAIRHPLISSFQKSISLYAGDLMPDHYDDWILVARERLRQRYLSSLEQLIQLLEKERQYQSAIHYARRLLREDPLHEVAYRRLMRLHALDGNVAGALRVYHTCNTTLQRELGVHPSPATQETYERLLKKEAPSTVPLPARVPLVAREPAWNKMQKIWRLAANQKTQIVLITGEAGIGKTRLAEELLDWADRQGITTVTAACYAAEGRLPYAPVADWLRVDEIQAVFDRMEARWLTECARLRPELLAQNPNITPPTPLTEGWQRQHFFTAVAHAILNLRQPLLFFVDDLQWCDQDTLDWLHFLLRFDPQARFLLLGTVRTEEVTSAHPLISWQQYLQRSEHLTTIQLSRLDGCASSQLAAHITGQTLSREQSAHLYAETEGNPLFVVEMARAGLQQGDTDASNPISPLPDKVRAVLATRLAQLSPSAQNLCELAATIGRSFTFELLAAASVQEENQVVAGLDELWQRRIVREKQGLTYDFSHDKLRQTAYAGLSNIRRRWLHQRVVVALTTGCAGSVDEVAHQIAAHYEAMGNAKEAIVYYQRAAEVAARMFAQQEQLAHLQRALALMPQVQADAELWVMLLQQKAALLTTMGEYAEARDVLDTAVSKAPTQLHHAELLYQQGETWLIQLHRTQALHTFDRALALLFANEESMSKGEKWWQLWLDIQFSRATIFYFSLRLDELSDVIQQLQEPIEIHATLHQRRRYLEIRNSLIYRQKRYQLDADDVAMTLQVLTLAESSGNEHGVATAQFAVGFTYLWSGNAGRAILYFEQALEQAIKSGNIYLQDRLLAYLTQAYRYMNNVAQVQWLVAEHARVSAQGKNRSYIGMLYGQRAWLCAQDGEWETAVAHGNRALETWENLPFAMQHIALWPLITASMAQNNLANAITYAKQLLAPIQQPLATATTTELEQAITAWKAKQPQSTRTYLQQAIQLAEETGHL